MILKKDDVITFEELGVDKLFIDEAYNYKNLYLYTKMRNVAGIGQSEAVKSSDMFMKCRYMDEMTNGKGIVFATGTPVSNSMTDLYTMQRYLQYDSLRKNNLEHFDRWASTFGETQSAFELSPEGTGYRVKTRFSKFYNLPELMSMFKEVADMQTAYMLNLPTPEAHYEVIKTLPSEEQKEILKSLSERADDVRNRVVELDGEKITDKKLAGEKLLEAISKVKINESKIIGKYRNMDLEVSYNFFTNEHNFSLNGATKHLGELGTSADGNITRLDNALEKMPEKLKRLEENLISIKEQLENAKEELKKPFEKADD